MRKHRQLWNCRPCGKRAYPTQARANEAIDNHIIYHSQRSRLPVRVYPCPYNDGVYHLTSSPEKADSMSYKRAEVFDDAADYIEKNGWHQGDYYPGADNCWPIREGAPMGLPMCVQGAIYAQVGFTQGFSDVVQFERYLGIGYTPTWNDAPERTKQEVLDALRLAAKNERILADGGDAA